MRTMRRLLIAAGLLALAPGLKAPAQTEGPALVETNAPAEPIAPPITNAPPTPITNNPEPVATAMPANVKHGRLKAHKEKERGSTLTSLKNWVCYTPSRLPCECGWSPTCFRPPLYNWFICKPGTCVPIHNSAQAGMLPAAQPLVTRRYEEALPKVEMPALVQKDPSLVPGSAAVMADRQEPAAYTPVNYNSLPVVPDQSGRR